MSDVEGGRRGWHEGALEAGKGTFGWGRAERGRIKPEGMEMTGEIPLWNAAQTALVPLHHHVFGSETITTCTEISAFKSSMCKQTLRINGNGNFRCSCYSNG